MSFMFHVKNNEKWYNLWAPIIGTANIEVVSGGVDDNDRLFVPM